MGRLPKTKAGMVDYKKMHRECEELFKNFSAQISPKAKVMDLSIAEQQIAIPDFPFISQDLLEILHDIFVRRILRIGIQVSERRNRFFFRNLLAVKQVLSLIHIFSLQHCFICHKQKDLCPNLWDKGLKPLRCHPN